jgi:hypothetical protein
MMSTSLAGRRKVTTIELDSRQIKRQRWQRQWWLWVRFCEAAWPGDRGAVYRVENPHERLGLMRKAVNAGTYPDFAAESALEAADLQVEWDGGREPEAATRHGRGTAAKVHVLAARLAAGQDLWRPDDAGQQEMD